MKTETEISYVSLFPTIFINEIRRSKKRMKGVQALTRLTRQAFQVVRLVCRIDCIDFSRTPSKQLRDKKIRSDNVMELRKQDGALPRCRGGSIRVQHLAHASLILYIYISVFCGGVIEQHHHPCHRATLGSSVSLSLFLSYFVLSHLVCGPSCTGNRDID